MVEWFNKIKGALKQSAKNLSSGLQNVLNSVLHKTLSENDVEEISDLLLQSDVGWEAASKICKGLKGKTFETVDEAKKVLASQMAEMLKPYCHPFSVVQADGSQAEQVVPQVIIVAGVNGSGKTTTIAKLSKKCLDQGLSVEWAACDTFRAAAVDQMDIWSQRLNIPMVQGKHDNSSAKKVDPAAVAFQAFQQAIEKHIDVLFIDTAGRLHNNTGLMQELSKIVRTVKKINPKAPHQSLLVLDGTTGQNARTQVESFSKILPNLQLIVTKLDGTAKAGFVLDLCQKFQMNIAAIGLGESLSDLDVLDPRVFSESLLEIENQL